MFVYILAHIHLCFGCFCVSDFQQLLKLEPGNRQALTELQKLQTVRKQMHLLSQQKEE